MRNDIAMSSIAQNLLQKYYGLSRSSNVVGSLSADVGTPLDNTPNGSRKLYNEEEPPMNITTIYDDVDQATKETNVLNALQHFDSDESSVDSSVEPSCRHSSASDTAKTLENDERASSESHSSGNVFESETRSDASFVVEENDADETEMAKTVADKIDDDGIEEAVQTKEVNYEPHGQSSFGSSLLVTKPRERTRRRFADLPSIPHKLPIYDATFVDLTNAGIETLSLDVLLPYSNIRMLYLENNLLTELPDQLFPALPSLEWLDVRNNQLYRLPNNIKSHPELRTLLLQGNKIEILPIEIGQIRKLKILQVAGNPLVMPPKDVVARGSSAILHFLRTQCNELHPQEAVTPMKTQVQRKSLTIVNVSEEMPRNARQTSKASLAPSQSIEQKRKIHECNEKDVNVTIKQKRLFWIQQLRKWLDEQTSVIQRMKDDVVRKEWRLDKRSFAKSMEKAAKRQGEGDVPFAIDIANRSSASSYTSGIDISRRKNGRTFTPPNDIDEKVTQLFECLDAIQQQNEVSATAPASKQQFLSDQIKKIRLLRDEILYLQRYNDVAPVSKSRSERL